MEWEFVAPMVVIVVGVLTAGGVLILRPLSTRLAELVDAMARNKEQPRVEQELAHVRELMETMARRLELVEERQDFTDQLLRDGRTSRAQLAPRVDREE